MRLDRFGTARFSTRAVILVAEIRFQVASCSALFPRRRDVMFLVTVLFRHTRRPNELEIVKVVPDAIVGSQIENAPVVVAGTKMVTSMNRHGCPITCDK
jgi:hypothetical protein